MAWSVSFDRRALKDLHSLDRQTATRILKFLNERLVHHSDPRELGKAMQGAANTGRWLYRVGDYRLVCLFHDQQLVVTVIRVGHRREVYERMP